MIDYLDLARRTAEQIRHVLPGGILEQDRQVFCIAEEAGEFVGAYRRWKGMARRNGTREEMEDELADVIITAFVTAEVLDVDIERAINRKADVLFSRGWKEQ